MRSHALHIYNALIHKQLILIQQLGRTVPITDLVSCNVSMPSLLCLDPLEEDNDYTRPEQLHKNTIGAHKCNVVPTATDMMCELVILT